VNIATRRRGRAATFAMALLAAGLAIAVGSPTAAYASDNGDRSITTSCGSFQSPPTGTAHAKIRNCSITWKKNILDGTYRQTVTFQLIDALTDGYCAQSLVQAANASYQQVYASECNGVWTTKTANLSGHADWIQVMVNYGTTNAWRGITQGYTFDAPGTF